MKKILMLVVFLSGCSNLPEKPDSSKKLLISYAGFFNSETPKFNPKSISYSYIVNFKDSEKRTSEYARALNYTVWPSSMLERNFASFSSGQTKSIKNTFDIVLAAMNENLSTGVLTCSKCSGMKFINLTEVDKFKAWSSEDRLVLVVGLETLSPSQRGLRSGLTAVSFDRLGDFKSYSFTPYNFTVYNTNLMVEDTKKLLDKVLP